MPPKKKVALSLSQERAERNDKSLEELVAESNKRYGAGTVVRGSDVIAKPPRLTTGSLWYDLALGGGWPVNAWSEIIGLESSGKTAVTLGTVAANMGLDPKFTCLWCASEPFDTAYAAGIGVDLSRLYLLEENTMEIVFKEIIEYVNNRAIDLVVIDSYPSLIPATEDVAEFGATTVSPGARIVNQFMRKGTKASKRSLIDPTDRPFTGIIINQWRDKITMFGDPRTSPGGKGKNFWMAVRAEVIRSDYLTDSDEYVVGQTIKLNAYKNKSAAPKREGICDFYFAESDGHQFGEFDTAGEVIALSVDLDVLQRVGNAWHWGTTKLAKTKGELEARIRSEQDLCDSLAAAIRLKVLGAGPEPVAPTPIREPSAPVRGRGRPRIGKAS